MWQELKNELDGYVKRTSEIRALSGAGADGVGSASGYSRELRKRYTQIGSLAEENRQMLTEILQPILHSHGILPKDAVDALTDFCNFLLHPWPEEDLDLTILFLVTERLVQNALATEDDDEIVRQLNNHIYAAYNNMNRANRIRMWDNSLIHKYQEAGLGAAEKLLSYLSPDRFCKLKDPQRKYEVLNGARFYLALYDTWYTTDEATNQLRIDGLKKTLAFAEDPFFMENTPVIDWTAYRIRTLEHMGQLTENGNQWQLTERQCREVYEQTLLLERIWNEDPKRGEEYLPRVHLELILARGAYYGGEMSLTVYRQTLLSIYERFAKPGYDMYSVLANLFIPTEYLATVQDKPGDEQITVLYSFYRNISAYLMHSTGKGAFSFFMEYLSSFLDRFVELPGRYDFERMCLNCMVALHPPTYVHSMQTGAVSKCLTTAMLEKDPAFFSGAVTGETIPSEEILSFIDHAAHCHDIGKLYLLDTISVYGRDLENEEFSLIHLHPGKGEEALARHPATAGYARIAGMHHMTYDGKGGYSAASAESSALEKACSSILAVADSLDAATDGVGRSYRTSKSFSAIVSELRMMSGSRYDPAVVRLLDDPVLLEKLEGIMSDGREKNYQHAFETLRNIRASAPEDFGIQLDALVKRIARIRELSSPMITDIKDPDSYSILLKDHFAEIGILSVENRDFLEETLYPLIEQERPFSDGEAETLYRLCEELINGQQLGDLDCRLVYLVSARLLKDATEKGDTRLIIRQLDMHVIACYELSHQTKRMKSAASLLEKYRLEGLEAATRLRLFLNPDLFSLLPDEESRSNVLMHSRYDTIMYEVNGCVPELNSLSLQYLLKALGLAGDAFYREQAPEYQWNYHIIRTYEYIGQGTEVANDRGFDASQLSFIADQTDQLVAFWDRNPAASREILPRPAVELLRARNYWLTGRMNVREYRSILLSIYRGADHRAYDFYSILSNLLVPVEYIVTFEGAGEDGDAAASDIIRKLYEDAVSYAFHATGITTFDLMLEYYSELLYHFREIQGAMSFMELGLMSMAALHPPTYVHSRMVGDISRYFAECLLERDPEAFWEVRKTLQANGKDAGDGALLEFVCNAGLCHDFGKLPMIDTISTYGRSLLDSEFALLKHHPVVGAELLKRHISTAEYADTALEHHLWYDRSVGYPLKTQTARSGYAIVTDIVSIADSLDAATDSVGRSYNRGKDLWEVFQELRAGSGTRYAPRIVALLDDTAVRDGLVSLLEKGRKKNYRDTWQLLNEAVRKG